MFRDAPRAVVAGYARLLNLSNIVDSKLAQNGVLRDGQWAVGVDVFRRLKLAECRYLEVIANLAIQTRQGNFATASDGPPAGWKPTLIDIKQALEREGLLAEWDAAHPVTSPSSISSDGADTVSLGEKVDSTEDESTPVALNQRR